MKGGEGSIISVTFRAGPCTCFHGGHMKVMGELSILSLTVDRVPAYKGPRVVQGLGTNCSLTLGILQHCIQTPHATALQDIHSRFVTVSDFDLALLRVCNTRSVYCMRVTSVLTLTARKASPMHMNLRP